MRTFITLCGALFITLSAQAQDHNPLINSGEIIKQAIALHDKGEYTEAIKRYSTIPRSDSNYYYALYEMALSQMTDSQYTAALQNCEKGLAVNNDRWPEFYTLYGNLIDDTGNPERALRIYDSAIYLYPAYSQLYLNKGTTLIKLERYKDAATVLKQCLLINPYQSSAHYKLAVCAREEGLILQSFLGYISYLLVQPGGYYKNNCISALSAISKAGDDIKEAIEKRTADPGENFAVVERIILSKIALDKQYKPLLKLDDAISRQIQVLLEKLEYDENDPDFWMQYYVPLYKKIFNEKKFEPFIYRLFATIDIATIQDYLKKKEKNVQEVVDETVAYLNNIQRTRQINYAARNNMGALYHYENGRLAGKGKTTSDGQTFLGEWEFYYYAGNRSSKGSFNEQGKRTGLWEYYYFDGSLKGKQLYKNGELEGKEIFYFSNGVVSSDATFVNGEEEGESKTFFKTGSPRTIGLYKNGVLTGERRLFFANGNLQVIENYKDDKFHGPFKTFYNAGPLESEGSYTEGEIDGPYKSYYPDGTLTMEGSYAAGKLSGPWKHYHENGTLKSSQSFTEGINEGIYEEYYDNKQLYYRCEYKKGKVTGEVEYFDKDGKLYYIFSMDKDIVKTARYFDKSGKEIGRSERKAKRLDLTGYYPDGYKVSQAVYNDNGEITEVRTYFYRSGKPSDENYYEKGKLNGPGTGYHPNGKKRISTYFIDGEKHGYEQSWYLHGQLEDEGWYQEGQTEGTWLHYDELGNLRITTEYLNSDPHGYKTEYYPDGKLECETKYGYGWIEEYVQYDTAGSKEISRSVFKNGSGKIKSVFPNGKTYAEGNYVNGFLDGPYTFYFFDGKVNTQRFYKKGKADSTFRNYYHDGTLSWEGQYKLGQKEGEWKSYYPGGKLHYREFYKNGELSGTKTYYYQNGKTDRELVFEKDERNGWCKYYDADGNLMYQIRFREDLPVAYTYQDKTGKLLPEIPIPGGTGSVKAFYTNGNPSAEFAYADGKLVGLNTSYYPNGKLKGKGTEDYSLSEGSYKYYHANGQLKSEYMYAHNNLHGPYKEYNEKGILTEEGYYYNDEPHQITKTYDDNGKLKETRRYHYGKLLDIKK